jgi:hypothetical protein
VIDNDGKIIQGRAFWDDGSMSQPDNVDSFKVNIDDFKDRG